ncbi:hypothetical protein D3C72_1999230 [compost metagenome]
MLLAPSGTVRPTMYELALKSSTATFVPKPLAVGLPLPKALTPWPVNQPSRVWPKASASFRTSKSYAPPMLHDFGVASVPSWLAGFSWSYVRATFSGPFT